MSPIQTDEIVKKLDPWLARHQRPAWRPVAEPGDGTPTASKFGSTTWTGQDRTGPAGRSRTRTATASCSRTPPGRCEPGASLAEGEGVKKAAGDRIDTGVEMRFRSYLAVVESLLAPDRPAFAGASRINTSLFPQSRYRTNPRLRPPAPPKPPVPPLPPSPGIKV